MGWESKKKWIKNNMIKKIFILSLIYKGKKQIQFYFETEIKNEKLKNYIGNDLLLNFQHNKEFSIQYRTGKKSKNVKTEKVVGYLKLSGNKILPKKLRGKFGEIIIVNGKNHILIRNEIIEIYKNIYNKLERYDRLMYSLYQFIDFFNNIEKVSVEQFPDLNEIFYFTDIAIQSRFFRILLFPFVILLFCLLHLLIIVPF